MYTIKAVLRWMRMKMRVGVTYEEYTKKQIDSAVNFVHPIGYYEVGERCLAYLYADGSMKYKW